MIVSLDNENDTCSVSFNANKIYEMFSYRTKRKIAADDIDANRSTNHFQGKKKIMKWEWTPESSIVFIQHIKNKWQ